jgi:hypothetical protein
MNTIATNRHQPWNKGKLVGQKAPLRVRDIWAIRVRLQLAEKTRDLALFNLAIDSKLRACDLTKLRVRDIAHGEHDTWESRSMTPWKWRSRRKSDTATVVLDRRCPSLAASQLCLQN